MGFLTSLISPLISAGASLLGGQQANSAAADNAASNQKFQEDMSNTAIQRRVKDLMTAGLNPMLAYSDAASTPTGSVAPVQNVGESAAKGFSSGAAASQAAAAVDNIKSQSDLNRALIDKAVQDSDLSRASAAAVRAGTPAKETEGIISGAINSWLAPAAEKLSNSGKSVADNDNYVRNTMKDLFPASDASPSNFIDSLGASSKRFYRGVRDYFTNDSKGARYDKYGRRVD